MLRKTLNLSHFRLLSNCLSNNRCFCSQNIKSNEVLVKTEDKNSENNDKSLTEKQMNELITEVVRSDKEMDRIWELNQNYGQNIEYHKSTDWYGSDKHRLNSLFHMISHQEYDFSGFGLRKHLNSGLRYVENNIQRYVPKRHAVLGPDLGIACFVVGRGGRVRFKHAPNEWSTSLRHFPNKYDNRYKVISIDASGLKLVYQGIDNFVELDSLEELNLSNNKFLDDWTCDKLGRLFRSSTTLSTLDLSSNPDITHRGIETLHRIRSLTKLNIKATKAANYPFLELLNLCFTDLVPNCRLIS